MTLDPKALEAAARAIYDALEGPVANQSFTRQVEQWDRSQELAIACISAYEAAGWQDISTAPLDRAILVYGQPRDTDDLTFKAPQVHLAYWDTVDAAFCLDGGTWLGPFIEPTHWHPLPEPPESSGRSLADATPNLPPTKERG